MQQLLLTQPFATNPLTQTTNVTNTIKAKQTNVYLSDFSIYSFPFSSILISPKNRNIFILKPHFRNNVNHPSKM